MKKTTTELEIEVSKGRIIEAHVMPDGKCKLLIEVIPPKDVNMVVTSQDESPAIISQGNIFVKVEASKLSLEDKFMQHIPKTDDEKKFMEMIKDIILKGPKDFWHPKYDPSFDDNGGICYEVGKMPATRRGYNWWEENAKKFCPERGSRLGTVREYITFLAVLIKKMVDNGWTVANAWHEVCDDSEKLGHYRNSGNGKEEFETTGSREVCGWYDLANTSKILKEGEDSGNFCLASGWCGLKSWWYPLADVFPDLERLNDYDYFHCGWLVLTKDINDNL